MKWMIGLVATFFSLFLAEGGAKFYIHSIADDEHFTMFASLRQIQARAKDSGVFYAPHNYVGYVPSPGFQKGANQHNSLGFRGEEIPSPKPEGEYRIVCLGGSTTYTTKVEDFRLSYPAQLEDQLKKRGKQNVRVINAGTGGYASYETLVNFLFRVLDLEPDMIIVYHAINDVHSRLVWPSKYYRGDNSGRRSPVVSGFSMPSVWEYSDLIRILLVQLGKILPHSAIERNLAPAPKWYYGNEFYLQSKQGNYPEGVFQEVSVLEMLEQNKPTYFKRNLENLIAVASYQGVKVVLATFAYSKQFVTRPRVSSEEYITALNEMNDEIRNLTGETNAELFDFANIFPSDEELYVDGRHVTIKGAELKAELFANFLLERELI